jgi:phosphoribosyl 1,2-cyclic phosphate phosphodiesterase
MKIKFLGTSAGWPLPRLGCRCKVCQSADPKDKRLRSSILIDDKILIDAGFDIYHQFLRYGISKIEAILITHGHPDHITGLWDIGNLKNSKNIKLFCTNETFKNITRLLKETGIEFDIKIIKEKERFNFENYEIQSFPVVHSKSFPEVGFKITPTSPPPQRRGGLRRGLVYIPDVRILLKETRKIIDDTDVLIVDGSFLKNPFPIWTTTWGHWSILEAIENIKDIKNVKQVYFTHIGHLVGKHSEINAFLKKNYSSKYQLAYDGLEIDF